MIEPSFDADGYPTEATLRRIRRWPVKTLDDMLVAMDYAGRAWHWPDMWERTDDYVDPEHGRPGGLTQVRYVFSTGGWSGNESIVSAIERNRMLQMIGAWSWRRGGHYEYRFPTPGPSA